MLQITVNDDNSVTLSPTYWKTISRRLRKLDALEAGGVDNWEWHDASLEEYYNELVVALEDEDGSN